MSRIRRIRVLLGGGWYGDVIHCRSADRVRGVTGIRYGYVGFRVIIVREK